MFGLGAAEWAIVGLAVKVALSAMVFSLPPAIAISYWLARSNSRLKIIISALVHLPLVVPPVVTGYWLLLVFSPASALGGWMEATLGISIAFRWTGAALAAAVMAFPLLVRPLRLAFESIDQGLVDTAHSLGAGRIMTFASVILPLAYPGILAGLVLGFAKALGEFGATITFVSNIPGETQTLSLAIYSLLQSPTGDSAALRLVVISVILSIVAVVASEILLARQAKRLAT